MKLSREVREQFRRHGQEGGRARAARMTAQARAAVARKAAAARWIRSRFGSSNFETLGFPGGSLIDSGLAALAEGTVTIPSLLVSLSASRLRREGVPVGTIHADPEDRLFSLLLRDSGELAHARYGAYLRQVSSFADACRRERIGD